MVGRGQHGYEGQQNDDIRISAGRDNEELGVYSRTVFTNVCVTSLVKTLFNVFPFYCIALQCTNGAASQVILLGNYDANI